MDPKNLRIVASKNLNTLHPGIYQADWSGDTVTLSSFPSVTMTVHVGIRGTAHIFVVVAPGGAVTLTEG